MKPFEHAVLTALDYAPPEHWQRVDNLMFAVDYTWWFFHFRLDAMVRKGWVEKAYYEYSQSRWLNNMPFYRISDEGRTALREHIIES